MLTLAYYVFFYVYLYSYIYMFTQLRLDMFLFHAAEPVEFMMAVGINTMSMWFDFQDGLYFANGSSFPLLKVVFGLFLLESPPFKCSILRFWLLFSYGGCEASKRPIFVICAAMACNGTKCQ